MATYTAAKVSIETQNNIALVNSYESPEKVNRGDFLCVIEHDLIEEIISTGTAVTGQPTIELARPWGGADISNAPAIVIPTTGNFAEAVQALLDAQVLVNDNFSVMVDWQTQMGTVTFTHPNGTTRTVKTLPEVVALQREIATNAQMYEGENNETLVTPRNFKAAFTHFMQQSGFTNEGGVFLLSHNTLKNRDAENAHPADAIDWSNYNLSAQTIANAINAIPDSYSSLGNVQSITNVENLKSMRLITGETIELTEGNSVFVKTQGYHHVFDSGGAYYKCQSLIAARNEKNNSQWEPTGFDSFYLYGGTEYVAVLMPNKELYLEEFGIFPELDDCLTPFELILSYQKPVRTAQTSVDFRLSNVIFLTDLSVDLDLNGCYLISNGSNERCLLIKNNLGPTLNISSASFSNGRTRFTVPSGHGIQPNDKIKAFSNQNINPYSEFTQQRCAEYFFVESVTASTIVCVGKHIWRYDAEYNPRLCKLNLNNTATLKNIKVGRYKSHNGDFAVAIEVQGYFKPELTNIHADSFPGQLLSIRSCYRARMINISADFLLDDTRSLALGYVGVDYGSQESEWRSLNGGKVRHTYTTGADSIAADSSDAIKYGGAVRCHIYTGITVGSTNFAYDTHQDAWECEFHDITVYDDESNTYASSGAFQDRSQNNIVHRLTHISDGSDVSAGQRTVLYNTGTRNLYIKEIITKKTTAPILSSFGLSEAYTDKKQHFRVDKIVVYQEKTAPRITSLSERIGIDIGKVDVFPFDADRDFYGTGGDAYFYISDSEADLTVHNMNLWFDRINLPETVPAGSYLVNVVGEAGNINININTYTNENTFERFEGGMSGLRSNSDDLAYIKSCLIHWKAYVSNYQESTMKRTGVMYNTAEFLSTVEDSTLKYTYEIIGDGIRRTGTFANTTRSIYEPDMHLNTFDHTQYGLRQSGGVQIDQQKDLTVSGQSDSASIATIDAPAYSGQIINLTNLPWNPTSIKTDVTLKAEMPHTDLTSDRTLKIGENLRLMSYEQNGELVWNVPVY